MKKSVNKLFKSIIAFSMVIVLSVSLKTTCFAQDTITENSNIIISEGYTEEGIHYTVAIKQKYSSGVAIIQTIIKREFTVDFTYDGHVDVQEVLRNYKIYADGVEYTGDLYLQGCNYEPWSLRGPYTTATYKGLFYANV
ncbi:hypothetical protein [Butyrivibrio hungatei]|uniref:Uncharacterized protein n=1 Tax=Butyrivibrio hungatei TaxID=185008 RepID=A0A1D9P592_9FIRM|nr:hypothetical protein [Butyrivibrio hungatei]AOZ97777.1 hypothetical protein bhn_I2745 [Butyrivibrio hungatei]